jgi:predicted PurR-regulated permease PerM
MPTPRTPRTRKTPPAPPALLDRMKHMTGGAWAKVAAFAAVVVLACAFFYAVRSILASLFFAFLVAYVLDPVVDWCETRGVRREVTVGAVGILVVVLLLVVPLLLIPNILSEADHLANAASAGVRSGALSHVLDSTLERLPFRRVLETLGWMAPGDREGVRVVLAERLGGFVKENAILMLKRYSTELAQAGFWAGTTAAAAAATLGRGMASVLLFIGNIALFAFVTVYLLVAFDRSVASMRGFVPQRHRARFVSVIGRIDVQLRAFLRGQMLVCLCLAVMYMLGLWLSGVPFGIVIGLLGGLASFVPYLGLSLAILPSIALVLVQHGLDWHVVGVLLTFGIAQTLEGTVITPRIVGEQVGLSPVWIILAIMVFGSLMGFIGLILAVPIAATLKVLIAETVESYKASSLFTGGAKGTTEV